MATTSHIENFLALVSIGLIVLPFVCSWLSGWVRTFYLLWLTTIGTIQAWSDPLAVETLLSEDE
jgi:hypothetical protein